MATVSVDIDMDEIDTDDLIKEIANRIQSKYKKVSKEQKKKLLEYLQADANGVHKIVTLNEMLKAEHFNNVASKYSLAELQNLIPE